jgi:OmcA/MtrC family decaheme c-type cytochrome
MPATYQLHGGGGELPDSSLCQGCHTESGGFVSVRERHFLPWEQPEAPTFAVEIISVSASAGSAPSIDFIMSDRSGVLLDSTASVTRLTAVFTGPLPDYPTRVTRTVVGSGAAGTLENLGGGSYRYTFNTAIEAAATGTWAFGLEGYRQATLPDGTTYRHATVNPLVSLDVTGALPVSRPQVIDTERCNSCHFEIAAHGNNRTGSVEYCITCHTTSLTDAARRPAGAGDPVSVAMMTMTHRIHRGEELVNPYVVYGFGGTAHDFSRVRFPGGVDRCESCHLEDTEIEPTASTCVSCHDNDASKAHVELNTTESGLEICSLCHGPDEEVSVKRAHAR